MTSSAAWPSSGSANATFAATLVDEWARAGVTDAVVAPGSRSAPLALALDADSRMRVHVHHDERGAGFLALGMGLASGRAAVVVTTSGTAAVGLHPAVVEAHHAGVPLVACTADRPPELHGVGAAQTIDQRSLFAGNLCWSADPGPPDALPVGAWRSLASRAVGEAMAGPGPVHLNLAFREPLVGPPSRLPEGRAEGRPWHSLGAWQRAEPGRGGSVLSGQGVVVAGRGVEEPEAVVAAAEALGWPLLADPLSGCRRPNFATVAAFDALVRHVPFAVAHRPDVVLRVGAPPASRALDRWLAGVPTVVVAPRHQLIDPGRDAIEVLARLPAVLENAAPAHWLASWNAAERRAQAAIEAVLARHPEPTEPGVARQVMAVLPAEAALVVSSSMPIRDVEWYAAPRVGVRVLANRGSNGIDGIVSTALGVGLDGVDRGAGTVCLLGDVAFLHDIGGLAGAGRRGVDVVLVVVDNDGGGIFEFLPLPSTPAGRRLFGAPHGVDLGAVARSFGIEVAVPETAAEVGPSVAAAIEAGGVRVVRVRTDRHANLAVHDELNQAVAATLRAEPAHPGAPGA